MEVGIALPISPVPAFTVNGASLAQIAPLAGYARLGCSVDLW
jgi:hypothetical protein